MEKKTQIQWVLNYLRKNQKGLTSMRAFWVRITRLSAIIYYLRHKKGYFILTLIEPNRFTRGTHARYILIGEPKEE